MNNNINSVEITRQVHLVNAMHYTMDKGAMRPEAGYDLAVLRLFPVWGLTEEGLIPTDLTDDELMGAYDTAFNPEAKDHWEEILQEARRISDVTAMEKFRSQQNSRRDNW